jgi:Mg-chelatase subunit ChlD
MKVLENVYGYWSASACVALLGLSHCASETPSARPAQRGNPGMSAAAGRPASINPSAPGLLPGGAKTTTTPSSAAMSCAGTNVQAGRRQPLVTLVIDGSGSMCAPFANATRWTALRSALMDQDGVVTRLQSVVSFGMTLYDGPIELGGFLGMVGGGSRMMGGGGQNPQCAGMAAQSAMGKACPNLVAVPQALDNAAAIASMYPMTELGGSTPTHKVMTVVVDQLIQAQTVLPDQRVQPQYIVLATDGEPNELCANPSGVDPHAEVIKQVMRAAQAGIGTFVISLAGSDAGLMNHLVQVAKAGMTGYPPFTPMSKADLVASLGQIIGGAVGCEVFLNGTVTVGQECGGTVAMNGTSLRCNDANGWNLKDDHTLVLQGQACMDFQTNPLAILHADFPCGVFVPS